MSVVVDGQTLVEAAYVGVERYLQGEPIPSRFEVCAADLGPRVGPRMSDAGQCSLALWARAHDVLDIPESRDVMLFRFALGAFFGRVLAHCIALGLPEDFEGRLEPEVSYGGVSGHVDLLITKPTLHVVEVKSTYFVGGQSKALPHWKLQALMYCAALGANRATVVIGSPAQQGSGQKLSFEDLAFDAQAMAKVEAEVARLRRAYSAEPPAADADAAWRCRSCRYSGCERNANIIPKEKVNA
jgi:CRISPR/Cas system-associated exonuclease Cas4 (RecB family)